MTSVSDAAGTLSRSYDQLGNLLSDARTTSAASLTTAYAYDGANRIASITYPSGATVSYTRDTMGRITALGEQPSGGTNTSVASNITYEPFGPYNGLTNGNGVAEARGFDQDYRLTGITDIGGSSTLQSLTYGYYPTNNLQTITNAVASNTGSANLSYGYGTGSDQLATLSVGGTVVQTIGYTADGRIASLSPGIQAPAGQYITSLSYNQDGRLTSVNAGAGTLASYTYDGFEQRLIKTGSGSYGEIYQYGQDGALLEETDANGVAQADYIYLNGRPIAVLNGSMLYFLHDDTMGTPQLATDSNQAVQWQANYDAFGQASVSGTVTQNLRLPGQYFDVESGWNHNGFRDYAPGLGRYIEPDPLGRLGSGNNLYAFVNDNPANLVDRLGLCPKCQAQQEATPSASLAKALAFFQMEAEPGEGDLDAEPESENPLEQVPIGTPLMFGPDNPGPLAPSVAATLMGREYSEITIEGEGVGFDNVVYRNFGGTANSTGLEGTWYSLQPQSPLQSILDAAVKPEWGNTFEDTACVYLRSGTTVYVGLSAPQTSSAWTLGGTIQIYVPSINASVIGR